MQIKLIRPVLFGIVLLFLMMIAGIGSADEVNVDFISHLGGSITKVVVDGDFAYIGQGQDFVVLDITDVNNPIEVGKKAMPGLVTDIAISGNHAYITSGINTVYGTNSLVVLDISTPSAPKTVGGYPYPNDYASGVTVAGDYAYVSCNTGLEILDVSISSAPVLVGKAYNLCGAMDVFVSGDYAYVAMPQIGLVVLDISNPALPKSIGNYNAGNSNAYNIEVVDDIAYVTMSEKGMMMFNIANPASPTLVGSYSPNDAIPFDVAVSGNYAYIANSNSGNNGLAIIDVTDVSSPKVVGKCDTGLSDYVTLSGNHAFVVNGENGLSIVDIADASSPKITGNFYSIYGARRVSLLGDYAYIADEHGLSVIDLKDPSSPKFAGKYSISGTTYAIATSGNYAYLASGDDNLVVVDISNPSSPKFASNCYTGYSYYSTDITLSNKCAFIAYNGGLSVVDISDPLLPKLIGSYKVGDIVNGVAVEGDYAYAALREGGFIIIDISNPAVPTLVGKYSDSYSPSSIAVSGNRVYLANGGLSIVDVSDRSSPSLVVRFSVPAQGVNVSGNYAYVSALFNGLYVVDITNSASPTIAAHYATAGISFNSCIRDNYVYVADGGNGLVILRPNLLQYELNKVSRDTIYKYQISDTEIDNYVNQGYSSSEINQILRERTVSDKQGRVLSAFIEASENEQQKGEIQSIIDNYQHDFEILAVKLNEYVEEKVAEPSSFWNSAKEKSYFTILPEDKGFLKDTAISLIQDFAEFSDKFSMKILSGAGTIVSYVDTRESQEELEQDLIESENAVSTDVSNSIMTVSKISSLFSPLADLFDRTGYTSNVIDTSAGNLVKVTAKLGEKKVTVPQKVEEEWKYVWGTVGDNKAVVLSATDDLVYVNDMHCQARVYDNPSDEKEVHYYIHINGKLREDFIGKKFGWRETGHWREIRKLSATKWEIVPVTESSSGFVSQASPYSTDELTDKVESNSLNDVYPMQISNVFSNDSNGDGFADILRFDIVGDGESNLLYTDVNGDQIFDMWEYTDSTNHIIGYDITGDGKTDVYDMDSDGNEDAWDLDGDGKIDQIDLNNDGNVEAYDTNYDGSLDTFVEYGHEIVAWITSIPYGATYSEGENILFNGSVFNGTKKAVLPFDYAWNSDKDGLIGKGKTINLSNLSVGNHTISLTVKDSNNSSDVRSIPIVILPSIKNAPPIFEVIGNKTVTINSQLSFTILATDSDGDKITYSATGMPTGAVLNGTTGVFSWTPITIGSYDVTFTATANGLNDSEIVTITVNDWNPWNDPDSDGGGSITLSELQQAIYDWRFGIPVSTGEMVSLSRLQELIYSWRFG